MLEQITIPYSSTFPWTSFHYNVTASSSLTSLSFVSLSPNGGAIIDDVSVELRNTSVPDIGSLFGIFSAVCGLMAFARRRLG
jgi:hypothetical protein